MKFWLVCGLFCYNLTLAQTGPAGVGNAGTNFLWLKADVGTSTSTNGNPISAWNDQSGNGIIVSQSSVNQQPLYTSTLMNGFPAVLFDNSSGTGQNDYLSAPDNSLFDNTNGYSFFTVTQINGFSNAQSILSKRVNVGNEEAFMLFFYTGNNLYVDIDNSNDRFSSGTATPVNTPKIYDVFYDGTLPASSRSTIYDQEQLLITSSESSASVADKNSPLIVGATHVGDPRPFNGYMSEIIAYRVKVNTAQRIILNNYLSAKYNIGLSTNDRYAGDLPANGDYDREVAGIGSGTDGTNLAFSSSVCGGLGISSVSGLDLNDYILAGHAFPNNSEQFTDVAGVSGVNVSRWQRIWYIDITNTGTANTTNLYFDMSDGGMTGVNLGIVSNYVLLYRPGQTGTWTELATATGISGDEIQFDNQLLTLDGYYTLATRDFTVSPLPVTLLQFDVEPVDRVASITWSTENETDLAYFEVERSKNVSDWETILEADPNGQSGQVTTYQETDWNPLNGVSYYRLKCTDLNGSVTYSSIRSFKLDALNSGEEISVYPNPSDGTVINVYLPEKNTIAYLYALNGQLTAQWSFTEKGWKTIQPDQLASGLYLLKIADKTIRLEIRR